LGPNTIPKLLGGIRLIAEFAGLPTLRTWEVGEGEGQGRGKEGEGERRMYICNVIVKKVDMRRVVKHVPTGPDGKGVLLG